MKTVEFELGGKKYTISERKRKANAKWRRLLEAELVKLSDLISGVPEIDVSSAKSLGDLVRMVAAKITGSVDIMAKLLIAYSPTLEADEERIDEDAYDSELLAAFTEVLSLAYPFGSLMKGMGGLIALGRAGNSPTTGSSSSQSMG